MEELGVTDRGGNITKWPTAGQAEIDYRFATLVKSADAMMVLQVRWSRTSPRSMAKTACFMPKSPFFGDNGSGMHTHQSLWKKGKPLFAGKEYAGLSRWRCIMRADC